MGDGKADGAGGGGGGVGLLGSVSLPILHPAILTKYKINTNRDEPHSTFVGISECQCCAGKVAVLSKVPEDLLHGFHPP